MHYICSKGRQITTGDNMRLLVRVWTIACTVGALCMAAPVYWTGPDGNGHGYEAIDTAMSWTDINTLAASRGGYVVTITTAEEQAFVFSSFGGARRWIGLTDQATEGTFAWITGESVVYTNWDASEPNNSTNGGGSDGEDLAELRVTGAWNDVPEILDGNPFLLNGVIEYDAVPEPASGALVAAAIIAAILYGRCGHLRLARRT